MHQFNRSDLTLQGPDAPKPYYGNYVQPKCNRSDARATLSGRGPVMGAFSTILERRLQLTVRTLGQAVRTPSGRSVKPSGRPPVFDHNFLHKYRIGTKSVLLES
jgi:hypothetical protein